MSIAPSSPFDLAAQISAAAQRITLPPIPPLQVPGTPTMPAPPSDQGPSRLPPGGRGICQIPGVAKLIPQLCPAGSSAPIGDPNAPATSGSALCSIPLIGKFACDLGQRTAFVVLAIFLIVVGVYVLIGGGTTKIDVQTIAKTAKAVAA